MELFEVSVCLCGCPYRDSVRFRAVVILWNHRVVPATVGTSVGTYGFFWVSVILLWVILLIYVLYFLSYGYIHISFSQSCTLFQKYLLYLGQVQMFEFLIS